MNRQLPFAQQAAAFVRTLPGLMSCTIGVDRQGGYIKVLVPVAEMHLAYQLPDEYQGWPVLVEVSGAANV